ncbi:hypothetical protein LguiB_020660 [Lonicera macranthoides]
MSCDISLKNRFVWPTNAPGAVSGVRVGPGLPKQQFSKIVRVLAGVTDRGVYKYITLTIEGSVEELRTIIKNKGPIRSEFSRHFYCALDTPSITINTRIASKKALCRNATSSPLKKCSPAPANEDLSLLKDPKSLHLLILSSSSSFSIISSGTGTVDRVSNLIDGEPTFHWSRSVAIMFFQSRSASDDEIKICSKLKDCCASLRPKGFSLMDHQPLNYERSKNLRIHRKDGRRKPQPNA